MPTYRPLAEILRPSELSEFIGQRHLLDPDKPIGKALGRQAAPLNDFMGAFWCWKNHPCPYYLLADGRPF